MPIKIVDWATRYENNRTRDLKHMQWVPMPNRHDGDGYTTLLDHPNGAAHFGAWCALVQVASRCDERGTLLRHGAAPHDSGSLARMTRIPESVWLEVLPRLVSIGWIEDYEIPQEGATIPHPSAMNGTEWNGKNGMNTSAPTRSTESAQRPVTYDFTTGLFSGVTDEMVATWQSACPAVSVDREIVKAAQWLLANPKKRKQNYRRFLLNWIMRAQERGKG